MVGDILVLDDGLYVIVWDGGELLPDRVTKPGDLWGGSTRVYNKTGRHTRRIVSSDNRQPETERREGLV